jgi:hypothetical protein
MIKGKSAINLSKVGRHGGAVDTHGARDQRMCVFVCDIDRETEPAQDRRPMRFTEIYFGKVAIADFRKNPRSELGTRTATLDKRDSGVALKLDLHA